jgi:hypothetical protein
MLSFFLQHSLNNVFRLQSSVNNTTGFSYVSGGGKVVNSLQALPIRLSNPCWGRRWHVPPSSTATPSQPQGTSCSSWAKDIHYLSELGHNAVSVMAMFPFGVFCVQGLECIVSAVRGKNDKASRTSKAFIALKPMQLPTGEQQ